MINALKPKKQMCNFFTCHFNTRIAIVMYTYFYHWGKIKKAIYNRKTMQILLLTEVIIITSRLYLQFKL